MIQSMQGVMKMKKVLSVFIAILFVCFSFAGCGNSSGTSESEHLKELVLKNCTYKDIMFLAPDTWEKKEDDSFLTFRSLSADNNGYYSLVSVNVTTFHGTVSEWQDMSESALKKTYKDFQQISKEEYDINGAVIFKIDFDYLTDKGEKSKQIQYNIYYNDSVYDVSFFPTGHELTGDIKEIHDNFLSSLNFLPISEEVQEGLVSKSIRVGMSYDELDDKRNPIVETTSTDFKTRFYAEDYTIKSNPYRIDKYVYAIDKETNKLAQYFVFFDKSDFDYATYKFIKYAMSQEYGEPIYENIEVTDKKYKDDLYSAFKYKYADVLIGWRLPESNDIFMFYNSDSSYVLCLTKDAEN